MQGQRLQVIVPLPLAKQVVKAAKKGGVSISRYLAELIAAALPKDR